jgi:hypothetical protein
VVDFEEFCWNLEGPGIEIGTNESAEAKWQYTGFTKCPLHNFRKIYKCFNSEIS